MRFQAITNHKLALNIGVLSLAIALVIERFLPSNNGLDFIAGFLFGISIVLNMSYIGKLRNAKS